MGFRFSKSIKIARTKHLRDKLTNDEFSQFERKLVQSKKSVVLAYINSILFGVFGGHRFYLDRKWTGLTMILISVLSEIRLVFITLLWLIIDLFRIPEMVHQRNLEIENRIAQEILERRQN